MSVRKSANKIEAAAKKLGYDVRAKEAQTGTIYIYCDQVFAHTSVNVKIRVADHQDAYGTADYTADDVEGTYKGAIAYLTHLAAEGMAYMPAPPMTEEAITAYLSALASSDAAREARRAEVKADGRHKTKSGSQYIANVITREEYLARVENNLPTRLTTHIN